MAWTAPATWSVSEIVTAAKMNTHVRDNLDYLKGSAGTITLDSDILYAPTTAGIQTLISLRNLSNSASAYGFARVGNDGGTNAGLIRGSSAASAYAGANALNLYTGSAHNIGFVTNDTLRGLIDGTSGNLGMGTASPQGRIHARGAISSCMIWEYDGVDGTARTVIPDGSGDVQYSIVGMFTVRASDGGLSSGNITSNLGLSSGTDLYNPGGAGTNVCRLLTAANGSVTVQRTAGALTYKVALWLLWLST